jgi:hypothetical protein
MGFIKSAERPHSATSSLLVKRLVKKDRGIGIGLRPAFSQLDFGYRLVKFEWKARGAIVVRTIFHRQYTRQ